jgi:hypothetical protein
MRERIKKHLGWILICGFTAALLLLPKPSRMRMSDHSPLVGVQRAEKDLTLGIKNYLVEFNHYPIPPEMPNTHADQRFESTGKLLAVLLGENIDGLNPRQIAYLEPPIAKSGKHGLITGSAPGEAKLMDTWGHPYVILIDANHDNKIDNPDRKNSSPQVRQDAPEQLIAGVVAYSLGPDGIDGTHDDIVSWRDRPPSTLTEQLSYTLPLVLLGLALVALFQFLLLIRDLVQWIFPKPSA